MADYKQVATESISRLPIAKHLGDIQGQINGQVKQWRKGEFTIFSIITALAILIGGGLFAIFAYKFLIGWLLPIVGMMAQYIIVGGTLVLLYMAKDTIAKYFKGWAKALAKKWITDNPFEELSNQLKIMVASESKFVESRALVGRLRTQLKIEAQKKAEDALSHQGNVTISRDKAKKAKDLIDKLGPQQVEGDETQEYIDALNDFDTYTAAGERAQSMYEQTNDFARKFGDRGAILDKLDRKLSRVGNRIKIKIEDFRQTITQLKNEYEVANNLRAVTDAAKSALLFETPWELDYAMEVITSSIATNLAITSSNLADIDMTTGLLLGNADNEAAFLKLDALANKIDSGESKIVNVDKYNNPNYKRTLEDKKANPAFGDNF